MHRSKSQHNPLCVGQGPGDRPVAGVQWLTGRSSKIRQTFGFFQGPLQHDRQNRFPNEVIATGRARRCLSWVKIPRSTSKPPTLGLPPRADVPGTPPYGELVPRGDMSTSAAPSPAGMVKPTARVY